MNVTLSTTCQCKIITTQEVILFMDDKKKASLFHTPVSDQNKLHMLRSTRNLIKERKRPSTTKETSTTYAK